MKTATIRCLLLLLGFNPASSFAEPSPVLPVQENGFYKAFFSKNIADIAMRDIGKSAKQIGVSPVLWCARAVEKWREEAGFKKVGSARAIDQIKGGKRITKPEVGALMITKRGNGNHVDVVSEVLDDGNLLVIGGNIEGLVRMREVPPTGIFVLPR